MKKSTVSMKKGTVSMKKAHPHDHKFQKKNVKNKNLQKLDGLGRRKELQEQIYKKGDVAVKRCEIFDEAVCVCVVCVCERESACLCGCVCVCVRERERVCVCLRDL